MHMNIGRTAVALQRGLYVLLLMSLPEETDPV